jgi:hypothetical protein
VLDERARKLSDQEKRIQQQLTATNARLSSTPASQKSFLRQRIAAYNNQLGVIDEQNNDISATPVTPGSVITPAQPPAASLMTRSAMFGGAGLAVGLFASVLLALALERSDRRLRDLRAVQRLGVPVLSTVPSSGGLVLVTAPKSKAGEAYRRLRAAVVASVQERPVTLLVTSATPAASATLTSSNLAVALAHAGSSTIMVDASFSETSPSALFGLGQSKGLSDVLMRGTDPTQLLVNADSQLRPSTFSGRRRSTSSSTHPACTTPTRRRCAPWPTRPCWSSRSARPRATTSTWPTPRPSARAPS